MSYDRAEVENALPAVWDDKYLTHGLPRLKREAGLPRATSDPSHGNGHIAVIADLRRAWALSPLTLGQKQALILRFGFDEEVSTVGRELGIDKSSALRRIEQGVGIIVAWLNGDMDALGWDVREDIRPTTITFQEDAT